MNHNVTTTFNGKTKTIQADKALELFNKMKAKLLEHITIKDVRLEVVL